MKKRLLEDQEDEESCNSTASSPHLRHKDHNNRCIYSNTLCLNTENITSLMDDLEINELKSLCLCLSQSDGSTETLSVMDMDESGSSLEPSTLQSDPGGHSEPDASLSSFPGQEHPQRAADFEVGREGSALDPQRRSMSMDSAYGTLSPESMVEAQSRLATTAEDDSEEDKVETTAEDENVDEEDKSLFGSQNSVAHSLKPRRRPPVQCRLAFLERLAVKSRSEDNLLSTVHHVNGNHGVTRAATERTGSRHTWEQRVKCLEGVSLSRSLTELNAAESDESLQTDGEGDESDKFTCSLPSAMLLDTLRKAKIAQEAGGMHCSASDGELSTPSGLERMGRGSGSQQHKKLTLAQLYRIRTTLVLNSTLTAS